MAKRRRSPASRGSAPAKPAGRKHTSVYLPEAAYEALRQVAFDERRKIQDLLALSTSAPKQAQQSMLIRRRPL